MRSKRWLALCGCLVLMLGLVWTAVACGEDTSGTDTTSAVATTSGTSTVDVTTVLEGPQGPVSGETPQYGGTLVVLQSGVPTNIGAFWTTAGFMDSIFARWAVENLVGLNEKGEPVPQLATGWDVDEDAKTITFYLRENVTFHDGTDFNAEAAKWNLDMFRNGVNAGMGLVTAVDVVDEYTVSVTLSKWDPLFIKGMSALNYGKMVSPTAYETLGEKAMLRHPVGTGPFEFDDWKTLQYIKYKRFDNYWQEGLPYLDAVEIRLVKDPMVALASYKGGEGQVLFQTTAANANELEAEGSTINSRVLTIFGIGGDSTSPDSPYSDQKVREAVAYAIDNEAIVNGVFNGQVMLPVNQFAYEGMEAYNADIEGYPYNLEKAKQLLAESEFNISPENPWVTTLTYNEGAENTQMITLVQEALAKVGIEVSLNSGAFLDIRAKSQNGFENELILFAFSYNGIEMDYSTSMTSNLSEDRVNFLDIWIPDEFNALYRQMKEETDLAERELLYQELNKMIVDDYCLVPPLAMYGMVTAVAPEVHDLGYADVAIEFLPETAWMSE